MSYSQCIGLEIVKDLRPQLLEKLHSIEGPEWDTFMEVRV